ASLHLVPTRRSSDLRRLRFGGLISACPPAVRSILGHAGYQWGRWVGRDNWMRAAYMTSGRASDRVYLTLRGFFAPDQVARLMDRSEEHTSELQSRFD